MHIDKTNLQGKVHGPRTSSLSGLHPKFAPAAYLKSSLYGSLLAVLVLNANSNRFSSLEGIISTKS